MIALFTVLLLVLAGACGDASSSGGAGESVQGEATTTGGQGSGSNGAAYTVDMDQLFPQGPGRDLVLNNCQNCHTWVPIVVLQMNEQEWDRWAREHRGRVEALTDEQFATLHGYLKANFNPDTPVPELPPALLRTWTSY